MYFFCSYCMHVWIYMYIWLPITQTLYGNKNYFELTGGLSYQGSDTKMYEGNPGEIDFGLS